MSCRLAAIDNAQPTILKRLNQTAHISTVPTLLLRRHHAMSADVEWPSLEFRLSVLSTEAALTLLSTC